MLINCIVRWNAASWVHPLGEHYLCAGRASSHGKNKTRIGKRARTRTHTCTRTHACTLAYTHTRETLCALLGPSSRHRRQGYKWRPHFTQHFYNARRRLRLAPSAAKRRRAGGGFWRAVGARPDRAKIGVGKTLTSDYRNLFQPCFCRLDHSDEFCSSQQVRAQ